MKIKANVKLRVYGGWAMHDILQLSKYRHASRSSNTQAKNNNVYYVTEKDIVRKNCDVLFFLG
jgi:hypothetical protein